MVESTPDAWKLFFERHAMEDITDLVSDYPDRISLPVNFRIIENFDLELAETLEKEPESTLRDMNDALRAMDLHSDASLDAEVKMSLDWAEVRLHDFPLTKLRNLRTEHLDRLVAIKGTILKETEVRGRIITSAHECKRCGFVTTLEQPTWSFVEPYECNNEDCGRKGPFILKNKESVWSDTKKVRLQEDYEGLRGGEHPQTMDIEFIGDLSSVGCVGDDVTVIGIVRAIQQTNTQGKTSLFSLCLDVNNVIVHESDLTGIEITADDREKINKLSSDPDIILRLVRSFACSIMGQEHVKEGVLVCSVSTGDITLPDGTIKRGASHILIPGDPGVAKSQILQAAKNLIPRAQYATGDGSSKAGLTAAVVKDDFGNGRWSLEAGALVLADRSLAIIDELDKIRKEDLPHLNTVLDLSKIFINKAGINRTLWARCPVIAALNPRNGRFDPHEPLPAQVGIRPDTISRFDLVFLIEDTPDPDNDRSIAELQGKLWQAASRVDAEEADWTDFNDLVPEISPDLMRKYLIACKEIKVKISDECRKKLMEFFLSLRGQYDRNDGVRVIPVTLRKHEALLRLAKAEARLRHSNVAEVQDADRVIRLVQISLHQIYTDPETGKLDSDIIDVGMGKSQRDRIKVIREIIRTMQSSNGGSAIFEEIVSAAKAESITRDQVAEYLKHLKTNGEVIEVRDGLYRVVA